MIFPIIRWINFGLELFRLKFCDADMRVALNGTFNKLLLGFCRKVGWSILVCNLNELVTERRSWLWQAEWLFAAIRDEYIFNILIEIFRLPYYFTYSSVLLSLFYTLHNSVDNTCSLWCHVILVPWWSDHWFWELFILLQQNSPMMSRKLRIQDEDDNWSLASSYPLVGLLVLLFVDIIIKNFCFQFLVLLGKSSLSFIELQLLCGQLSPRLLFL